MEINKHEIIENLFSTPLVPCNNIICRFCAPYQGERVCMYKGKFELVENLFGDLGPVPGKAGRKCQAGILMLKSKPVSDRQPALAF